jgi:hypothetical protein
MVVQATQSIFPCTAQAKTAKAQQKNPKTQLQQKATKPDAKQKNKPHEPNKISPRPLLKQ